MNYQTPSTLHPNAIDSGLLLSAESLAKNQVFNKNDEELGSIKDIMLDVSSGRVNYAVLAFGAFLGMGEKLFAVPWRAMKLDTVNKRFILDVDKEQLKAAPGFDKDHWPNMADQIWAKDIQRFYDGDPQAKSTMR